MYVRHVPAPSLVPRPRLYRVPCGDWGLERDRHHALNLLRACLIITHICLLNDPYPILNHRGSAPPHLFAAWCWLSQSMHSGKLNELLQCNDLKYMWLSIIWHIWKGIWHNKCDSVGELTCALRSRSNALLGGGSNSIWRIYLPL